MDIKEQEALARQLWAIHDEAWPDGSVLTWDDLQPLQREAWIQVAQFVMNMNPPEVYVFNNMKVSDVDTEQINKQIREMRFNRL